MIPRVHPRHNQLARLVWYLYSPGKVEEHADPHLVAAWDGSGELSALEPPVGTDARPDARALIGLLAQPLHAARNAPKQTVWHCSIRTAPQDRILSDGQWRHIATEVMNAVGLAPHDDPAAVRWIAVRHAADHIHLVATLVRQDGRTAWAWQDRLNTRRACTDLEQRYGLYQVAPPDRTGHRRPGAAEQNKAKRLGRRMSARDELRRAVRQAAVAAEDEDEFFARLADASITVKLRHGDNGERTGYAVALATHTTADKQPVWFGGGSLARDLTLPRLRQRWGTPGPTRTDNRDTQVRVWPAARVDAMYAAVRITIAAGEQIAMLRDTDLPAARALAQAASDLLTAVAHALDKHSAGPLIQAAELFDQATREPQGRLAPATSAGHDLRTASRLLARLGRVSGTEDHAAALALLNALAGLADAVAALRVAQQREHQAEYARTTARLLRQASGDATAGSGSASMPSSWPVGPVHEPTAGADAGAAHGRPGRTAHGQRSGTAPAAQKPPPERQSR